MCRLKKINFTLIIYIYILSLIIFYQPVWASGSRVLCQSDSLNQCENSDNTSPFQLNFNKDIALTGSGVAMGISGLILMHNIIPLTSDEIARLDLNSINSFDRSASRPYRGNLIGDALLYGLFLLPLTFLSHERMRQDWKILAVMGAEVLLIQSGLNAIVKGVTSRTRPYVYDPNAPLDKKTSKDARVSFYSGHTSTTAAISFFIAKVFSDYHSNKTMKYFIWTGAALYPAAVGYLRVDSGHHFLSDVITGYIMGALIGYLIPEMHRAAPDKQISVNYQYSSQLIGLRLSYIF